MSAIIGFATYKNKHPDSFFEKIGDALLTPVSTLCRRNSFVVLKNEDANTRCIYTHTNTLKPLYRVVAEIVAAISTLPIALIGIIFKGLSLITSSKTRDIYFNWKTPIQAQSTDLSSLLTFATQNQCASQLLEEFTRYPNEYLVATHDEFFSGDHIYLPPYLNECSCVNSGYFNRFKNERRSSLETQLVEDTKASFPPSKETFKLNYIGFGAGELLQDFINIGKLIQAGYQDITVNLIDPDLKKEILNDDNHTIPNPTLEQFKFLLEVAKQKNISLKIHEFKSITEYQKAHPNEKAHIISAIDFEDYEKAFNDVTLCHKTLHKDGKFYLSYGLHDFCLGSTQCLRNKHHETQSPLYASNFKKIQNNVNLLAQTKQKTIRYAQLGSTFDFEELTRILPELAKSGCKKIEFTLTQPCEKNFFGSPVGPNAQFTQENLRYYLKLFLPSAVELEVKIVKSIKNFKTHVEHSNTRFDMITWCDPTPDENSVLKTDIDWIHNHACDNNLYLTGKI